ncbi:MAG: hypothetical protein LRY76_03685, partial [Alphaproteobacteria bacterium]|nr:hypothetical protein [Alphaproteobacteria bacterium]
DKQRGRSLEVGEWQNEATNDKDPTKQDVLEKRTESATDYEKDELVEIATPHHEKLRRGDFIAVKFAFRIRLITGSFQIPLFG